MAEKNDLLGEWNNENKMPVPRPRDRRWGWCLVLTLIISLQLFQFRHLIIPHFTTNITTEEKYKSQCPAQEVIGPKSHTDITERNVEKLFKSDAFRNLTIERLSGATQIPTEDFDDMGDIGVDPRWDVFYDLQNYFKETFPLFHEKLELEVVNAHGLVYTWKGDDSSLQPILLTGHQDVVPIAGDTLSQWKYPPFSGHFDGKYINGRGSHDCKNNVIAIFSSITALLEAGFTPQRTIVIGFGFDEESAGSRGAFKIAQHLEKVWGQDSFAILLDEGVIGIKKVYGRTFGTPQASEKGYLDMLIRVHVPGGHSSMAPPHTSIGIVSEAITQLEAKARTNFPSRFTSNNPFYYQLHCAAEDPHTDLSKDLRHALQHQKDSHSVTKLLVDDFASDVLLRTSQAVTIFKSGSKANALPQFAEALVDYRVSNEEKISDVKTVLTNTIKPIAEKYNLTFITRDESDNSTSLLPENTLSLSWWRSLEPSPVSSSKSKPWKYFSGVIKHVFDEDGDGNDVLVAPTIAQGNTDTKNYWNLSSQIYRFGPLRAWHDEGWGGLHDVNERIALEAHLEAILFYHEFIRVFDEADLD